MTTPLQQGETASRAPARFAVGELLFAVGLAMTGGFVLVNTRTIPIPPSDVSIGPRAVPYVVGAMLTVVGIWLIVEVLRGKSGVAEDGEDIDQQAATSWLTVAALVAAVCAHVFMIVPIGWPIATAFLFFAVAVVLGARPWWRSLLIGCVLALLLQYVFGVVLGLSLPLGPLLEGVSFLRG